ncbi:MAG: hypothetical protein Q4D99_00050 [Bacillota bacterium]|nr:hypothetical protein [Bacillota bacterium]
MATEKELRKQINELAEQKKKYPTIMIDIMAAEGKSGFYEKFGYKVAGRLGINFNAKPAATMV